MLKLHTIRKSPKSTHRRKVVGRGLGSGHGTYSTRGGKGQTARTGHSKMPVGFEGGRQPLIRQLPKNRGFKSPTAEAHAIRLEKIAKAFADGTPVTIQELKARKLLSAKVARVKVVGGGTISTKLDLKVPASKATVKAVIAAGGSAK